MKWILENMPLIAIFEGLILIIMGVLFYVFPEENSSPTALIPAIFGAGLLVPGYLAYSSLRLNWYFRGFDGFTRSHSRQFR